MNTDLMTKLKESERGSPELDVEVCIELGLVPAGTEPHPDALTGHHHELRPVQVWKLTTDIRECVHFLHSLQKVDWDLAYGQEGEYPGDSGPWQYLATVGQMAHYASMVVINGSEPDLVSTRHAWAPLALCMAILDAREGKRL